jgi:hypothetical protein
MIALANESAQTKTAGQPPKNGLNQNWLPMLDSYRTFLMKTEDLLALDCSYHSILAISSTFRASHQGGDLSRI